MTTSGVKYEIKDEKAREYLDKLPFLLKESEPESSSFYRVKKFALQTGDIASLSKVDMDLIALCHTMIK